MKRRMLLPGITETEKTPDNKNSADAVDVLHASILIEALKNNIVFQRPYSAKQWIDHFRKLRKVDGVSPDRIASVLQWYVKHINGEYVPQAHSAKSFRAKFAHIEAAKNKISPSEATVSDAATQIIKTVSSWFWIKDVSKQLPYVVQTSLDQYSTFFDKRRRTVEAIAHGDLKLTQPQLRKFVGFNTKMDMLLYTPKVFILEWFRMIHFRYADWPKWSGNLRPHAFSETSKHFEEMGRQWAYEYCGDGNRWDFYIEIINNAN
jgi:hypothetical protein